MSTVVLIHFRYITIYISIFLKKKCPKSSKIKSPQKSSKSPKITPAHIQAQTNSHMLSTGRLPALRIRADLHFLHQKLPGNQLRRIRAFEAWIRSPTASYGVNTPSYESHSSSAALLQPFCSPFAVSDRRQILGKKLRKKLRADNAEKLKRRLIFANGVELVARIKRCVLNVANGFRVVQRIQSERGDYTDQLRVPPTLSRRLWTVGVTRNSFELIQAFLR